MSTSIYPPSNLIPIVLKETGFTTVAELRENILEVDVWMQTMEVTRIDEGWAFTSCALFSNIGGTFGLFLGASLFSFIEIVDLLFTTLFKKTCCK